MLIAHLRTLDMYKSDPAIERWQQMVSRSGHCRAVSSADKLILASEFCHLQHNSMVRSLHCCLKLLGVLA